MNLRPLRSGLRIRLCSALLVLPVVLGPFHYRSAAPGYRIQFPRDHASHPDYRTEWWYYTGHLRSPSGEEFGFQLTFFRSGLKDLAREENPSAWKAEDLYFAHFALSDLKHRKFFFWQKMNRTVLGRAGSRTDRYQVWVENWSAQLQGGTHFLKAAASEGEINLALRPRKGPVLHGEQGLSRKGAGEGRATYYYSLTRLAAMGSLRLGEKVFAVNGETWMDHEFGSNQLDPEQVGWDWFGLQLEDGTEIMLYQIRRRGGGVDPFSSGTRVLADGRSIHLPSGAFSVEATGRWRSPRSQTPYPSGWVLLIPGEGIELTVTPAFPEQELDTSLTTGIIYWEGSVQVRGTQRGKPIRGKGYVELTGYKESLGKKFE
ncbi:MAG: carotenoid 1,2-hydratase [Candidatus Tectomicrobia bacterium]|uniref:Carotenoid 1,2-hydratase n=1 Tax=Tectimicrobiota bacterium TaxID=2528274 RepID=A0A932LYX0_UNCTE|nr:carotenoid 1,2-hydratase [Candidatus Tectomicrobia bacterium]